MSVPPRRGSTTAWSWPRLHEAQRAVLLDVLLHGSRSRAELARRTGLSRTSLTRLSRDLVELGFVAEGELTRLEGRGRPSEMLHLRPESAQFAGFKLTGEALYAVVTDLHAEVLVTIEHPLASRTVVDVVALIAEVVSGFQTTYPRLAAVGVCLAGDVQVVDGRSVVVGSHFLGWDEVPLERLVEDATRLPTAISNDVQALTLASHWFGAEAGRRSLALIGLGAGIGVGLVVNDELVRGAHGHPGKVGHLPVGESAAGMRDAVCDRGHRGCVSAFVTIPAIVTGSGAPGFAETLAAAREGSQRADRALRGAAEALGAVIAYLADIVDPERILVTGEGREVAVYARSDVERAIAERLDPASEGVSWAVTPFRFADYARAAGVSAIRQVVSVRPGA